MSWRKIPKQDWRRLYPSLAILLSCSLSIGLIAWWQHTHRRAVSHALAAAHTQLQQARTDTQNMRQHLQQAQQDQQYLQHPGKLERLQYGELRLEWLEQLAQISKQDAFLQLNYQIEAQQALLPAPYSGNATLFSSRMHVHYFARHEADFSRVHQRISQIPGLALPLMCTISRSPLANTALEVRCDYAWISLGALPVLPKGQL